MTAALKALALLFSVAGLAFMVAWYGFFEPSWLSYQNEPFEPVRLEVKAGELVALNVTRCNSSGEAQIYLIAASLIRLDPPSNRLVPPVVLPGAPVLIEPGCLDEISKANFVPKDTASGQYFIKGLAKADGRWRTSNIPWSSRPFQVLSANEPDPAPNRAPN